MSESSLIKLQSLRTTSLLKRDSNIDFFLAKFFKNTLFYRLSLVAASASLRFPACSFAKKETLSCFSVNFRKFLTTSFDRTPPEDCSLCLSENFEKFFRTPLLQSTLFHVQVVEFQRPDRVTNYFTSAFQAFYSITTNSY